MNQIQINLRGTETIYNYLYQDMPIEWREEDLLLVKLPDGDFIDVGWYPACDPTGWFKITLTNSTHDKEIKVIRVRDVDQVEHAVETLFRRWKGRTVQPTSCSKADFQSVPYRPNPPFNAVA
jgi:hypothetical protein